jgi:arginyl-tRNA synthetase
VYKTQIINDREFIFANQCSHGRNLKWRNARIDRFKGDKLVGNYYVAFDKAYKVEIAQLISEGKEEEAKKQAPMILEAQDAFKVGSWREELFHFGKNEPMGL